MATAERRRRRAAVDAAVRPTGRPSAALLTPLGAGDVSLSPDGRTLAVAAPWASRSSTWPRCGGARSLPGSETVRLAQLHAGRPLHRRRKLRGLGAALVHRHLAARRPGTLAGHTGEVLWQSVEPGRPHAGHRQHRRHDPPVRPAHPAAARRAAARPAEPPGRARCSRPTAPTCSPSPTPGAPTAGTCARPHGRGTPAPSPAARSPAPSGTTRCPGATTRPPASACKNGSSRHQPIHVSLWAIRRRATPMIEAPRPATHVDGDLGSQLAAALPTSTPGREQSLTRRFRWKRSRVAGAAALCLSMSSLSERTTTRHPAARDRRPRRSRIHEKQR